MNTEPENQRGKTPEPTSTGNLSIDNEVKKLVDAGLRKETAEQLVHDVVKTHRQKLFKKALQREQNDEMRGATYMVAFMISIIGPCFEITSLLWYFVAMLIAGFAGYYGYKDKPVAGITGAILLVILFPVMYSFYFSGRSSFIGFELIIPMLMAIVPAFLTGLLIAAVFYPNKEQE
jgi:hypothetical protein